MIIPTYNRKKFLKKSITSVLEQTYDNFELIVVDDGSSDGTDLLMTQFKDKRIRFIRQRNRGVSAARNAAVQAANGDFYAFLDSDDRWKKEKLENPAEYIQKFPKISIFHTEEIWYRSGKLLNQKKKHKKPTGFVYTKALALCVISISTAVVKKQVFEKVGMFDETFEACEDYDFWLRAANEYEVKLIPETLTIKDGGRGDQLSSGVWGLDRFRIKALKKMLDSGDLTPKNFEVTLTEFRKKCKIFAQGAKKRDKIEEAEFYIKLSSNILDKY